jgi:hypothetical protein
MTYSFSVGLGLTHIREEALGKQRWRVLGKMHVCWRRLFFVAAKPCEALAMRGVDAHAPGGTNHFYV